jgi:hypothetical protein
MFRIQQPPPCTISGPYFACEPTPTIPSSVIAAGPTVTPTGYTVAATSCPDDMMPYLEVLMFSDWFDPSRALERW